MKGKTFGPAKLWHCFGPMDLTPCTPSDLVHVTQVQGPCDPGVQDYSSCIYRGCHSNVEKPYTYPVSYATELADITEEDWWEGLR